jgi:hypothetical protein
MIFSSTLAPADSSRGIANSGIAQFPVGSGSWNPKVSCSSPWIVRVTDITVNMTGSSSLSNSMFNPGITSPVGTAKRWLTPGSTPSGWVSPGPPCTITNSHGEVAMFVEIDGVKRVSLVNEDCTGSYDAVNGGSSNGGSYCDSTFNFYDPVVLPNYSTSCTSASDPTCYGRIHSEIDHDWKAAKYCGASTTCDDAALNSQTTTSTLIDFQGFLYWDPGNLNQAWHSFSGWEIHPLTGWRVHQSNPSLTASFTFSPTAPTVGQTVTFTAAASGGTSPYTFNWSFGDGSTGTGSPATHSYSTAGTFNTQLTVHDSASATATASQSVVVTQPASPDFSISSNPSSISVAQGASGTSTIMLTSLGGFTGTITLSPTISPSGPTVSVNPTSVTVSAGGSGTSTLTVSTQSTTPLGSYTVIVTGNSGSISHSTTIPVAVTSVTVVPDFSISGNPSSITIPRSSSGTFNLTLASMNGFSGTVNLSVTLSPSGPRTSLSQTSINLSPGGAGSSTLTVKTLKKTHFGSYTVTVTATSGSLSHSITFTVTVG